jgi:hypothetical protein
VDSGDQNTGFLLLADAAARLGISRLKLREAIAKGVIPARRDNEGRLRADMSALPDDLVAALSARPAPPEALIEALFDEIEELTVERDTAEIGLERLVDLFDQQGDALDRVLAAAEARAAEVARLTHLSAAALAAADAATGRAEAVQAVADRAIGLADRATAVLSAAQAAARADLDRLEDDLARKTGALDGQARLLDRLFSLSESALETAGRAAAPRGLWDRVLRRK